MIKLYEVEPQYIEYLLPHAPHLYHNKKDSQQNTRKYIGVILTVNDMKYFAPLSSFKPKHKKMKNSIEFMKIGDYAVINLNNMFPVPDGQYTYVDIRKEKNPNYKRLLESEYFIIRSSEDKIMKNAAEVYKHKLKNGDSTALARRCNDFTLLEKLCTEYGK